MLERDVVNLGMVTFASAAAVEALEADIKAFGIVLLGERERQRLATHPWGMMLRPPNVQSSRSILCSLRGRQTGRAWEVGGLRREKKR